MAKSAKNKPKKGVSFEKKGRLKKSKSERSRWQIILISIVILTFLILAIRPGFIDKSNEDKSRRKEIKFTKEGELSFYKSKTSQKVRSIDIEISDSERERMIGLMHRYSMSEDNGMLFIMDREELQSFWMRNTYVSLDIIYLDKDLKIVSIQKRTQPLTDNPLPSYKKAKYVLEVVAGFCDTHKIEEGDYIQYNRLSI